jgi:pilus assembly protein CpaF
MFKIIVHTDKGMLVDELLCADQGCLIGKDADCLVVLRGWKVAKKHAQIVRKNDELFIFSLGAPTGIAVNDEKVEEYGPLQSNDVISVHSYRIIVKKYSASNTALDNSAITESAKPEKKDSMSVSGTAQVGKNDELTDIPGSGAVSAQKDPHTESVLITKNTKVSELQREWQRKIHHEVIVQMDLRRVNISEMSDGQLKDVTWKSIQDVIAKYDELPGLLDKDVLGKNVLAEAVGLGPLEVLLNEEDVSEIMVNAADEIFYEKSGKLFRSDVVFSDDAAVISAIERIVAPLGRRIDENSPMVDARLKDGSRVNAIIPPLALKGPSITIRKFMKERLRAKDFVRFGSATNGMMEFLEMSVLHRQNVFISGGTGSGKTTLLNVLSNSIPDEERIVTVEDAAELKLYQPNLVSLEARPPNQEGSGAIYIRDLVKNCLRMRPDRIVVGECRGGETLDMLQAMNTGHDGSLTTAHANSPRDAVSRIEVMVMMSGMDLPSIAIREQIASAVDVIVQQTRFSCGTRKITSICEVSGIESGRVQLGEIFKFSQSGYDPDGKVKGEFKATGQIPQFYEQLRDRGVSVDLSIFETGVVLQ